MDTDGPALPHNPELLNRQPKWFKPVFYGAIIASCIFGIGLVLAPMMFRKRGPHPGKNEFNNARQIGLALLEFDTEFGAYPNAATAAEVTKHYPSHGFDLSGSSSNALFRQFFASQITQSESMLRADILGSVRPDGKIAPPGDALKKGEVGFSYISGLSTKDDPLTPIVLTPLIPGTTKFDPKPFKGKAVILHIDNSVRTYDIAKDGHIYDAKGINLLSPKNPIWKGKAPDIRYPE
jgi:hypothetical protein